MGVVTRADMQICDGILPSAGVDAGTTGGAVGAVAADTGTNTDGVVETGTATTDAAVTTLDGATAVTATSEADASEAFRIKADVIPGGKYEYLPHTADIQLHSWGSSLSEALENLGVSMFGYMTDLTTIEKVDDIDDIVVKGHDLHTLIYSYLDEWLVNFHITGLIPRVIQVQDINTKDNEMSLTTKGIGEKFNIKRHVQGTEVKAITYSNMQVKESEGTVEIWVIIDI
jgi:SHS2 domain-containing protein